MAEKVEKKAEAFFQTPSGETDHRGNKNIPTEEKSPADQAVDAKVKESLKQADEYGDDLAVDKTAPQTVVPEQHPFGAPADSGVQEQREPVSLFPTTE